MLAAAGAADVEAIFGANRLGVAVVVAWVADGVTVAGFALNKGADVVVEPAGAVAAAVVDGNRLEVDVAGAAADVAVGKTDLGAAEAEAAGADIPGVLPPPKSGACPVAGAVVVGVLVPDVAEAD